MLFPEGLEDTPFNLKLSLILIEIQPHKKIDPIV